MAIGRDFRKLALATQAELRRVAVSATIDISAKTHNDRAARAYCRTAIGKGGQNIAVTDHAASFDELVLRENG